MVALSIALIRIKLDDVTPAVLRRIEVPLTIRLDRLHLVLQAALGWANSHLYKIQVGETGWGIPDLNDERGLQDASKTRLAEILQTSGATALTYLYDFGDGWRHTVEIERVTGTIPGVAYPRLLEAKGRCPPEDVGGPGGYEEFLYILSRPTHKQHAETVRRAGGSFDPRFVDAEHLAADVAALARKWSRRPRVRHERIH